MSDISIVFQQLEDMQLNKVRCQVEVNEDEEKYVKIIGFTGLLDISNYGGVDDISLIKDCINECDDLTHINDDTVYVVDVSESGEWEDVFWNNYYVVDKIIKYPQ